MTVFIGTVHEKNVIFLSKSERLQIETFGSRTAILVKMRIMIEKFDLKFK
jgi:hypothetical protein